MTMSYNHYHGNGGGRSSLYRCVCNYRALALVTIVLFFVMFFYNYTDSMAILKAKESEISQCQRSLDSTSAQLQVVYEHKTRLDKTLKANRETYDQKLAELNAKLKTANNETEIERAQLKELRSQLDDLKKQMEDLKTQKQTADSALVKANSDASTAQSTLSRELNTLRDENEKLRTQIFQLQQQNQQLQHQQAQGFVRPADFSQSQPYQSAAAAVPQAASAGNAGPQPVKPQQAALPAPLVDPARQSSYPSVPSVQKPAPVVAPLQPNPQAEQVALPIGEHQQQQLYNNQVPTATVAPLEHRDPALPVLAHPLGEDQQQLIMARPLPPAAAAPANVQAAAAPVAPAPAKQNEQPEVPGERVVRQPNDYPGAVADKFGDGGVEGAGADVEGGNIEPQQYQDAQPAELYKDDEPVKRLPDN